MRIALTGFMLLLSLMISPLLYAQAEDARQPGEENGEDVVPPEIVQGELLVTIESVEGTVEMRLSEQDEWKDALEGMVLKEGAEVSTGFDSTCGLVLHNDSIMVVQQLSLVKIDRYLVEANSEVGRVSLDMGEVRVKLNKGELKNDFKITTPNMTASVRGTDIVEFSTSPDMGDFIRLGIEGLMLLENQKGRRFVEAHTASNSDLIRLIKLARLLRTFRYTPLYGLTMEEVNAAFDKPDPLNSSPGGYFQPHGNPFFDRIRHQEGSSGQFEVIVGQ